jgi:hypothetical protein
VKLEAGIPLAFFANERANMMISSNTTRYRAQLICFPQLSYWDRQASQYDESQEHLIGKKEDPDSHRLLVDFIQLYTKQSEFGKNQNK